MDKNINKPLIIIISSPSGAGKTTICKNLLSLDSNIKLSISVTTRLARDNEVDGKDYYFINSEKFIEMLNNNKFLEFGKNAKEHANIFLWDKVINSYKKILQ